nr:spermatogenesis-associated protein 13 [Manis javanica]
MAKPLLCFLLQAVDTAEEPGVHSRGEARLAAAREMQVCTRGRWTQVHLWVCTTLPCGHGEHDNSPERPWATRRNPCSVSDPKMGTYAACQNGGCSGSHGPEAEAPDARLSPAKLLRLFSASRKRTGASPRGRVPGAWWVRGARAGAGAGAGAASARSDPEDADDAFRRRAPRSRRLRRPPARAASACRAAAGSCARAAGAPGAWAPGDGARGQRQHPGAGGARARPAHHRTPSIPAAGAERLGGQRAPGGRARPWRASPGSELERARGRAGARGPRASGPPCCRRPGRPRTQPSCPGRGQLRGGGEHPSVRRQRRVGPDCLRSVEQSLGCSTPWEPVPIRPGATLHSPEAHHIQAFGPRSPGAGSRLSAQSPSSGDSGERAEGPARRGQGPVSLQDSEQATCGEGGEDSGASSRPQQSLCGASGPEEKRRERGDCHCTGFQCFVSAVAASRKSL